MRISYIGIHLLATAWPATSIVLLHSGLVPYEVKAVVVAGKD
jgi:hypothetical protein